MAFDAFWVALLAKMAATVALVLTASVTAERAGPFWGGLICALPLGAGPAYVLLALQADARFIAASALASLTGTIAANLFLVVVVRVAPHRSAVATIAIGLAAWLVAILAVRAIAWDAWSALAANLVVVAVGSRLTRDAAAVPIAAAAARGWLDLPLRALAVGLLVALVVTASDALGPRLTGLAVVFPILLVSLTAVVHARLGGRAAAATMASGLRAMPGFFLALLVLHLLAPSGVVRALVAALATSIAYALAMMGRRAYAGGTAAAASASSQRRNSATLPSPASPSSPASSSAGLTHQ